MKERNPLFVAGFPYIGILVGYLGLMILSGGSEDTSSVQMTASTSIGFFAAITLFLIGIIYSFYWMLSTAKVLREKTHEKIPHGILLFIPIANYWWMWRYAQVADTYTKGKIQGALGFVLLLLLGSIGMGILQDAYNKLNKHTDV